MPNYRYYPDSRESAGACDVISAEGRSGFGSWTVDAGTAYTTVQDWNQPLNFSLTGFPEHPGVWWLWELVGESPDAGPPGSLTYASTVLGFYADFMNITCKATNCRVALVFTAWTGTGDALVTDDRAVWMVELPQEVIAEEAISVSTGPLTQFQKFNANAGFGTGGDVFFHPQPVSGVPQDFYLSETPFQWRWSIGIAVMPSKNYNSNCAVTFRCEPTVGHVQDLLWEYAPKLVLPPHLLSKQMTPVYVGNTSPVLTVGFPDYLTETTDFAAPIAGNRLEPPEFAEIRVINGMQQGANQFDIYRKVSLLDPARRMFVANEITVDPSVGYQMEYRLGDSAQQIFRDINWLIPFKRSHTQKAVPLTPPAPLVSLTTSDPNKTVVGITSLSNLMPAFLTFNRYSTAVGGSGATQHTVIEAETNTISQYAPTTHAAHLEFMEYSPQLQRTGGATGTVSGLFPFYVPVVAGVTYRGVAEVWRTATSGVQTLQVIWYDSARAVLSTSTLVTTASQQSSFMSATATAPANAVWARVRVTGDNMTSGANWLEITQVSLHRNDASVTSQQQGGYLWGNLLQHLGHRGDKLNATFIDTQYEMVHKAFITSVADNASAARGSETGSTGIRITKTANAGTATTPCTIIGFMDWVAHILPERLPEGTKLYLNAYIRSAAYTTPASIGVRFYDRFNVPIPTPEGEVFSDESDLTTSFAARELTVDIPEGASRFAYLVRVPAPNSASTIDIADFYAGFQTGAVTTFRTEAPGFVGRPTVLPGQWALIERKVGTNGRWAIIAIDQIDPLTQTCSYDDYCVTPSEGTFYRARLMSIINGQWTYSGYSSESQRVGNSPAAADTGKWCIRDPEGQQAFYFDLEGKNGLRYDLVVDDAVMKAVGSDRSVVTSDVGRGASFQLEVQTIDSADLAKWTSIHQNRRVIFLGRPQTDEWWSIMIVGNITVITANTNPVLYTLRMKAEEVDVPDVW